MEQDDGGHDPNRCLKCYANKRMRENNRGHKGYRKPRRPPTLKPWERADMRKPDRPAGKGGQGGTPGKGDLLREAVNVWDYLTTDVYDDGGKRKRATMLVVMDGQTAKVCLIEKALKRSLWAAGETLEAAVADLEERLATGTASWRDDA